ncbi:MAG TPA: DsrE family protein [Candidatus Methanoperedenaceae archaeon]|nr:DsrE family protein [Candidatus Methanoperedenaceae archaeon]
MTSLLLVLSKDPFSTEIPDLVLDIANDAAGKGSDVSLYLVEDGVNAARDNKFGERLGEASEKGIRIYADDKAVLSRAVGDKLIAGVEVREIGTLLNMIMDTDRVAWF